jgi:hypothetical protein
VPTAAEDAEICASATARVRNTSAACRRRIRMRP